MPRELIGHKRIEGLSKKHIYQNAMAMSIVATCGFGDMHPCSSLSEGGVGNISSNELGQLTGRPGQ